MAIDVRALCAQLEATDHALSMAEWIAFLWENFRPYRDNGLPAEPTAALPDTDAKRAVLRERASQRQCLFHPDDAHGDIFERFGRAVWGDHGRFKSGQIIPNSPPEPRGAA